MRSAAFLVATVLPLLLPVMVIVAPEPGRPVIVVVAPWLRSGEAIDLVARAGGLIVGGSAIAWIVVATSDDPAFGARLRRSGAWLTVNGARIAVCAPNRTANPPA